jgi:hypothetical protein
MEVARYSAAATRLAVTSRHFSVLIRPDHSQEFRPWGQHGMQYATVCDSYGEHRRSPPPVRALHHRNLGGHPKAANGGHLKGDR